MITALDSALFIIVAILLFGLISIIFTAHRKKNASHHGALTVADYPVATERELVVLGENASPRVSARITGKAIGHDSYILYADLIPDFFGNPRPAKIFVTGQVCSDTKVGAIVVVPLEFLVF